MGGPTGSTINEAHSNHPRPVPIEGTTGVRLICTLRIDQLTKFSFHCLPFAPALSGSTARPRAATLPTIAFINYAFGKAGGLRSSPLGCGARLAARGRPAAPDARRIVAALGRGSLLGGSDKAGAENTRAKQQALCE